MTIENALSDFLIEQQIRGNTQKTVQYYSLSVGLYAVSPVLTLHCRKSP